MPEASKLWGCVELIATDTTKQEFVKRLDIELEGLKEFIIQNRDLYWDENGQRNNLPFDPDMLIKHRE